MKELYKNILESVETDRTQNINKHKNSRVLIIDGLNTFIRCWTSIPTMNDDGDHVAGVTGVLRSIGYAIRQVQPTRVVVVFDGKNGSQSRKKIYGEYKAGRDKNKLRVNRQYADMMNEEDERESMKRQFVWLMEMLHELPVTTMIYDGVEAVVMSTDKDFLQLVDDKTIVWSPTKKKIYNTNRIKEEFGLDPKNLLLYRVLDGDKSDNIPGVYGCGIKTLLKRFPELTEDNELSIDDLFLLAEQKKEETKGKIKLYNDILDAKEQIIMNERLMQLKDVDISGQIKMSVLDRFNEDVLPLNKIDFLKVCMKYKVTDKFGDLNSWLKDTFGNLITD
jgi:5'-3' exonuclease